jgi:penicillin amidase
MSGVRWKQALTPWSQIPVRVLLHLSRRQLPQIDGMLRLDGLHDAVEVLRDRWGVPHIYARTVHDALYAQGFVHAQDRLWQMDFQRRVTAGRLAEVVGKPALDADRWMRILGLRRVAEAEARGLEPGLRAELDAYAAGVNAWIAQRRLPVEFTLLRYSPEPWTAADSLAWAKMLSWTLSINWESELLRAQLVSRLGPERAKALEPPDSGRCPYVIPPGTQYAWGTAQTLATAARQFTGPTVAEGVGSNNWAVSGARTAAGAPLLANDMHLLMSVPSIWYENHLVAAVGEGEGGLNVIGVSLPGAPGVVSGHNGAVAWGFTAGFADVQDLYVEHLRRSDSGAIEYEYRGEWLPAAVHREEIRVRGGDPVVEEVVVTRHGPIIDALAAELRPGVNGLALRWTAREPETTLAALHGMNRARNCDEFRVALRLWSAPVLNVVYADVQGDIAYHLAGRVPIRSRGDGSLPVSGATGEYEWLGYVPFDELPQSRNPAEGYLVTANNRVVADHYPHFISGEYAAGNRARRIVDLIEAGERLDVPAMWAMQFDQVSPMARLVADALATLDPADAAQAGVLDAMRRWDGTLSAESAEAAIYKRFMVHLARILLPEDMGDLADRYLGEGPAPVIAGPSLFAQRAREWLEAQLSQPESVQDAMRCALRLTLEELRTRLGPPENWAWGRLHLLTLSAPVGQRRAVREPVQPRAVSHGRRRRHGLGVGQPHGGSRRGRNRRAAVSVRGRPGGPA